jgi:xylan 1,4-beta-xylosidase
MRFLFSCLFVFISPSIVAQQLVLPGDHPDPSVVKIGDTYWASATTSNWAPAFPLLQSKDLVHWTSKGTVFPQLPDWADYYFWAPEITYENGKVYMYYAAHKKGGNLCVGIASADKPEGPYKDHGPLICQEVGSIDAFPMRDENGKLYMVWKEDANSVKKPTPIWAQELNEERTALIGEKQELFRNSLPWEGNLVEGVSMLRQGDYFYAIYAAAGCCGRGCTYITGVARSKSLLGPWKKRAQPLITDHGRWKCPGHGTPVEKEGRFYFLYHAYDTASTVYTGRQGLLQEFRFTPDGWIEMIQNNTSSISDSTSVIQDRFKGHTLTDNWQWSVFQKPIYTIKRSQLRLQAVPTPAGVFVGQKTVTGNYEATTGIRLKKSTAAAGIGLIGDEKNTISAFIQNGRVQVVQLKDGKDSVLLEKEVPTKRMGYLQVKVRNGKEITFEYDSNPHKPVILNDTPIDGSFLPPWDRSVRVALISKGSLEQKAVFRYFQLYSH